MTLSIAARCARTGMLGVAISSSSIAVAARCAFAQAGTGAVLTQNVTNPSLGPRALGLLRTGHRANDALLLALSRETHAEHRQLLVLDVHGVGAQHSGARCLGVVAHASAPDCIAAGNMLASPGVPQAMITAFVASDPQAHLSARLLVALQAGALAGGEAGPLYSAGLLVADKQDWPVVNLRVDWADDAQPVAALGALWARYEPQMASYITRALDPTQAPSYGVPGDQ